MRRSLLKCPWCDSPLHTYKQITKYALRSRGLNAFAQSLNDNSKDYSPEYDSKTTRYRKCTNIYCGYKDYTKVVDGKDIILRIVKPSKVSTVCNLQREQDDFDLESALDNIRNFCGG